MVFRLVQSLERSNKAKDYFNAKSYMSGTKLSWKRIRRVWEKYLTGPNTACKKEAQKMENLYTQYNKVAAAYAKKCSQPSSAAVEGDVSYKTRPVPGGLVKQKEKGNTPSVPFK